MKIAIRNLFGRKPVKETAEDLCIWAGHNKAQDNTAVAIVTETRDCGHSERGALTCSSHLAELHLTGGVSKVAVPCAECGKVSVSRVTKVEDLDV